MRSGGVSVSSCSASCPSLSHCEEEEERIPLDPQIQGRGEIGTELYSVLIDRSINFSIFSYLCFSPNRSLHSSMEATVRP